MIAVLIGFFDKKTEIIADEIKMEFPDDLIFAAADDDEMAIAKAEGKAIDYINCRPFDITDDMKVYAIQQYPELKEKFDKYLHEFIGRHGLGPEYD